MNLASNRKAYHEYTIVETFKVGIKFHGYEVKAVREGNVSFEGSFAKVENGQVILYDLHVGRYSKQSETFGDSSPKRPRLLLLNKYEIERLVKDTSQKGFSLVPLKLNTDHGLIKLELALVKGKKHADKKEALKTAQIEREMNREAKAYEKS